MCQAIPLGRRELRDDSTGGGAEIRRRVLDALSAKNAGVTSEPVRFYVRGIIF